MRTLIVTTPAGTTGDVVTPQSVNSLREWAASRGPGEVLSETLRSLIAALDTADVEVVITLREPTS